MSGTGAALASPGGDSVGELPYEGSEVPPASGGDQARGNGMYFTAKQLRILEFIHRYQASRGISPTMEEIAEEFTVTKITIYEHLNELARKGALKREKFKARSIELLIPVKGR